VVAAGAGGLIRLSSFSLALSSLSIPLSILCRYLHTNHLTGAVPSLPFKQYTGTCALNYNQHTNHFTCPLPAGAADCKYQGQPGVACDKKTE
jgi:hypothetical protein